jgi:hypothetical protein
MSNNTEQFNTDGYAYEPEPRKASDIILALESKVDVLQKLVFNQDMLLKLIADKTNKIFAYIDELQKEYRQSQLAQQDADDEEEPKVIKISNEHQITEATEIDISKRRIDRAGVAAQVQQPAVLAVPNQSSEKVPQPPASTGNKKVSVIQRVSDNTGKDMFMASVLINDEAGNEVHKTKTNAVGKWQAQLKPGSYIIKLTKTDTATKKILETTQKINVGNSNSTITLPVVIMNR